MSVIISNSDKKDSQSYFGRDLEAMSYAGNYYRWMLDQFQRYIGKSVLEVGAGSGNFTEFLLAFNPDNLVCLEPSNNMFPLLKERAGHYKNVQLHHAFLSEIAPTVENSFDTAFYVNVLEHIERDEDEIRLALGTLKQGGHLLIFVPAFPWLFGTADENYGHFRRYTQESITELFNAMPVKILDCRYFDFFGILPWWVSFVLLRQQSLSPGMVKLYDRFVVPLSRAVEEAVTPPIGKNLLLVVQKV